MRAQILANTLGKRTRAWRGLALALACALPSAAPGYGERGYPPGMPDLGDAPRTHFAYELEDCFAIQSHFPIMMLWMPGIATLCFRHDHPPEEGLALAFTACARSIGNLVRRYGAEPDCRLAHDGKAIVDPGFERALTGLGSVPVGIEVIEGPGGPRKLEGELRHRPDPRPDFAGSPLFDLVAGDEVLCAGFTQGYGTTARLDFEALCGGIASKGIGRLSKVVSNGDWYEIVPREVTLTGEGLRLRLTF